MLLQFPQTQLFHRALQKGTQELLWKGLLAEINIIFTSEFLGFLASLQEFYKHAVLTQRFLLFELWNLEKETRDKTHLGWLHI